MSVESKPVESTQPINPLTPTNPTLTHVNNAHTPATSSSSPSLTPFQSLLPPSSSPSLVDFPRVSHSFELVVRQCEIGLSDLRSIAHFIAEIATAKHQYAQALMKTSTTYATQDQGVGVGGAAGGAVASVDGMSSAHSLWSDLREHVYEESRQEQEFVTKVQTEIVKPMIMFYNEADKKRKLLAAHHAALMGQMKGLNEQLLQAKISTVKQIQAFQQQEEKELKRQADSVVPHGSGVGDGPSIVPAPAPLVVKSGGGRDDTIGSTNGGKSLEGSTRRALASVGSFFKGLKTKSSQSSSSASSTNGGHKSEFDSLHHEESSEDLREKAYAAALSYQLAVASSNSRQVQFYSSDLPNLFRELQRLELARVNCLKTFLGLFAANQSLIVGPNKQRIQSLIQSVSSMDGEVDCKQFVDGVVAQVGEVVQPNLFEYDLQWTPEDIRQAKMELPTETSNTTTTAVTMATTTTSNETESSSTDPSSAAASTSSSATSTTSAPSPSFFGLSLDGQMDLAEDKGLSSAGILGGDILDIPVVLHVLLTAIRERQGFNRPNLLFTTCDRTQLNRLVAQLDRGDLNCRSYSLDVIAGALKYWLRKLPTPLIPTALYQAAISAIKKDQTAILAERQSAHEAALAQQQQPPSPTPSSPLPTETKSPLQTSTTGAADASSATASAPATAPAEVERPRSSSSTSSSVPILSSTSVTLPLLPSAQLHQYVLSIFSALPTLNQRVITHLAQLVSDIAASSAKVIQLPSNSSSSSSSGATSPRSSNMESIEPVVDRQRWAHNMHQCSAVLTAVVLRNSQADTTEVRREQETRAKICSGLHRRLGDHFIC